eukprot:TRINITY_DN13088_c0_g1_i2.p1 TRINITY_DN13088_c0_g1~~TRINITY_DN13088_c0_g1_i2.p1  ORF type:complete len:330 (+),score=29.98 TRINITY_DN13088_c0_g1_i2:101-991(+)
MMAPMLLASVILSCICVGDARGVPAHAKFNILGDTIVLKDNPKLRLNVKGGMLKPGDPLVLWPCSAQNHELFSILPNGLIRANGNDTLCLNAEEGVGVGHQIIAYHCPSGRDPDENEAFEMDAKGRIRLKSHPTMCLNVKGGRIEQGTPVVVYPCSEGEPLMHEVFMLEDGLIKVKRNPDLHFNIKGGVLDTHHPVVLWGCQASRHEIFEFTPERTLKLTHGRGLCVNAEEGLAHGHRLIAYPCSSPPGRNELFEYDSETETIFSVARPELGFNVKEAAMRAGTEIILYPRFDEEL